MAILDHVNAFYSTYDTNKKSYFIIFVQGQIISYCNLISYPESDTLLDGFAASKAMELIRLDQRDYVNQMGVEGFNQVFADSGSFFNESDRQFLARYTNYFRS